MRRPSRQGLPLVLVLCAAAPLAGQNLQSIGHRKPLTFSGGLSLNQIFYSSAGIHARRTPYSLVASGTATLSLYGWAIPFSFSVSDQRTAFSQPFNRFSMHPSWKWITLHAGYTSMSFSPYTVNGHIFAGAGVDVAPVGKWKLSALYGRFLKAANADTQHAAGEAPSFERKGYGLKASWGDATDFAEVILFHAADDPTSIHLLTDSIGVMPQENLVVSVAAGKTFLRHLRLRAEAASSALTRDVRADESAVPWLHVLFRPRHTSSYYDAIKATCNYELNGWLVGLGWEHVDPGYRTLGAYYFNNDLENFTLNASGNLMEGKLSFGASGGVQHDNLDKTKMSTMHRLVGSLNTTYTPHERLTLSCAYSSFQTYANIRSPFRELNELTLYDNLDTLNFTQISRNASLSGMYVFRERGDQLRESLSLHFTWQEADDNQGGGNSNDRTRFYNINASWTLAMPQKKLTLVFALNGSMNNGAAIRTNTWGPTLVVTRHLFDNKVRTTLSSSYNRSSSGGTAVASVCNLRLNGSMAILHRHHITIGAAGIRRTTHAKSSREFTGTIGYSYSFGSRP